MQGASSSLGRDPRGRALEEAFERESKVISTWEGESFVLEFPLRGGGRKGEGQRGNGVGFCSMHVWGGGHLADAKKGQREGKMAGDQGQEAAVQ